MKSFFSYDEVGRDQILLVGGKGRNTALTYQAGFMVPAGFILSADVFRKTLADAGNGGNLSSFLSPDISMDKLDEVSERLRASIIAAELGEETRSALHQIYHGLIESAPAGLIVRSSATVEDSPKASLAGLLASFPDIRDLDELEVAVRRCWASFFTPKVHIYLREQGLLKADIGVAVLVQVIVPAKRSGVVFSMDPVTGDRDKVVVEAIFGFGEEIVSGEVTPERYIYSRNRKAIVSRKMGRQAEFITPAGERKPVAEEFKAMPKLSDKEVYDLVSAGVKLEDIFGAPQDIEWAFSDGTLYILQTRPIVAGEKYEKFFPQIGEQTVLLRGVGVSPAMGSGRVKVIDADGIPEVDSDTVVVIKRLTNELAVYLRRSAAVVTDEGGATSHGANILREFGVPCVLATENATEKLKEEEIVTVDGLRGVVYAGDLSVRAREISSVPDTRTKIFVSVLVPEKARNIAPFTDGVSSLRDDFFMFEPGVHPIKMIREGLGHHLEDSITGGIIRTLEMFKGKPVWYKTMDAPTDEFRRLKGSEDPEERNPLLGWRGIARELEEPEMLRLELRAIRRALEESDGDLGIKLPFIRFVDELRRAKEVMREMGLKPHEDVKIGISIENPGVVFTLRDFLNEGVDFLSVGLSDIVMCTLALDRESQKVAELFRPDHSAVIRLLDEVYDTAKRNKIFTCVTGESARQPSILPYLVLKGFDAIGVSLSFFADIKREVARIESEGELARRSAAGL